MLLRSGITVGVLTAAAAPGFFCTRFAEAARCFLCLEPPPCGDREGAKLPPVLRIVSTPSRTPFFSGSSEAPDTINRGSGGGLIPPDTRLSVPRYLGTLLAFVATLAGFVGARPHAPGASVEGNGDTGLVGQFRRLWLRGKDFRKFHPCARLHMSGDSPSTARFRVVWRAEL